jgi:hypothetical protein
VAEARRGAVAISWKRPTKAADGSRLYDLSRFVVQRRVPGGEFEPVATVEVTDRDRIRPQRKFEVVDPVAPGTYEYRVRAVTEDGQKGIPTAAVRVEVGE